MLPLKRNENFEPCPELEGDELFANGVFTFNITRLRAFIEAHPEQFPLETLPVRDLPDYRPTNLNDQTIHRADLSRPIIRAEISPNLFNVIDGHHRIARARRDNVKTLPAHTIRSPHHVPFITSVLAYQRYIDYWNSKIKALAKR